MSAADFLPWIPVFPLLGFLVNGLLYLVAHSKLGGKDAPLGAHGHGGGHGEGHAAHAAGHDDHGHDDHGHGGHVDIPWKAVHTRGGPVASGLSFVFALLAILSWWKETGGAREIVTTLWTWIPMGTNAGWFGAPDLTVDVAFRLDPLSALMLGFVTLIGTLIHVYSVGYMGHDEGYGRFFAYLNLFMFSMLTLVLGANLAILFVGWEGVGLCSYLLIGYYHTKDFAADAGKKAFVMNRIGDWGFLMGLFACVAMFGTVDFNGMFSAVSTNPAVYAAGGLVTFACLALFVGATFLFYVLAIEVQVRVFGVGYPVDRMAFPLVPLLVFATALAAAVLLPEGSRLVRRGGSPLAVLLCVASVAQLAATAEVTRSRLWWFDADTPRVLDEIGRQTARFRPADGSVSVGCSWMLEPSLNYYRVVHGLTWLLPFDRKGLAGERDFYVVATPDMASPEAAGLETVRTFAAAGTVLAVAGAERLRSETPPLVATGGVLEPVVRAASGRREVTVWIPAVVHASGFGGALWRSDLRVRSRSDAPARIVVGMSWNGLSSSPEARRRSSRTWPVSSGWKGPVRWKSGFGATWRSPRACTTARLQATKASPPGAGSLRSMRPTDSGLEPLAGWRDSRNPIAAVRTSESSTWARRRRRSP